MYKTPPPPVYKPIKNLLRKNISPGLLSEVYGSTIALAKSAMEHIPLHSWEMEFSIEYHVTINSQLNDQNSIRYYITPDDITRQG